MQTNLKIAAVQFNPTVGDLAGNLTRIVDQLRNFDGQADLVVFCECALTGYPLGDLVLRPSFLRETRRTIEKLASIIESQKLPAALVGAPRAGAEAAYNSAYLIDTDGSMHVTDKHKLPNSEVYDEKRTFAEGRLPQPIPFRGWQLGVMICEDMWHREVPRALADAGAELLIVLNGSHFRVGKQARRTAIARDIAQSLQRATLYVNQVGGQDELVFDGGSFVMDRRGLLGCQVGFKEASFLVAASRDDLLPDLQLDPGTIMSAASSKLRYPIGEEIEAYHAMVLGLKDYVRKCNFRGVVIGMSGGIDSALTAAVAVDALGGDRVLLVRMPSKLTSEESNDDAAAATALIGARMKTIPIAGMVTAYSEALSPIFEAFGKAKADVTEENIQARIRGATLMALSNKLGLMVLTTGNKSEMGVGYATLYGDMCGGYSVLKDAYKTTVFKLARWRNANKPEGCLGPNGPVMPERIIEKPPTAELAEGQTDEASLGPYEHLDAVLQHLVEGLNGPERAAELASRDVGEPISTEYAQRIAKLVWRAQYKREQAPPGVVLTSRNFGKGWRLPVVNAFGL